MPRCPPATGAKASTALPSAFRDSLLTPILPKDVTERLQKRFRFYTWNEHTGEVRWMASFDTTEADIDTFATAIAEELRES